MDVLTLFTTSLPCTTAGLQFYEENSPDFISVFSVASFAQDVLEIDGADWFWKTKKPCSDGTCTSKEFGLA